MTINEEILILANKIANNGNKPTVALIKAKLSKKVSLPVIISTLKTWQHEPNFTSISETKHITDEVTLTDSPYDQRVFEQELQDELADMKKEIVELKQLVKKLLVQQKQ